VAAASSSVAPASDSTARSTTATALVTGAVAQMLQAIAGSAEGRKLLAAAQLHPLQRLLQLFTALPHSPDGKQEAAEAHNSRPAGAAGRARGGISCSTAVNHLRAGALSVGPGCRPLCCATGHAVLLAMAALAQHSSMLQAELMAGSPASTKVEGTLGSVCSASGGGSSSSSSSLRPGVATFCRGGAQAGHNMTA
jgi:hypothetical protein